MKKVAILPKLRQQILPNAIEIGARKGGTRALLKALTLNPNIFVSAKEIHFFDKEVNYRKGLEWYRRRMPAVPKAADTIVMEKTPAYFVTEKVPARVHEMSPDVKLILVVRDPVKRAVSDYAQLKSKSPKMKPFESYVVNGYGNVNDKENFIRIGRYCEHLDRWLKYFPLSQIHVVSGEKLVKNPAAELHEVEKFLGVKPVISEKDFIFNKTKGFPCFRDVRVSNGNATYNCLGKTKGRPHPNVQKEVLDKLYAYYRNYNARFYKMVGKDFGWPK
ncbi:predicted protein [Nematostella vectensis]|uniref:Sulfotransferase domain-containing protein n=1 Tax=Nematostella vectensis TaxID=45351 RepID=A7T0S9_NEMVE|nr:predicted protein [Nematostella vectensis]|eukprot:XP_001622537.1 predicted protein [Nematostella vectensis]